MFPVKPRNKIIMAVCIIIAKLCISKLITRKKHRRALAAHKHKQCIPYLPHTLNHYSLFS